VHLPQGKFSRDGAHSPGAIFEAQEVFKRRHPGSRQLDTVSA